MTERRLWSALALVLGAETAVLAALVALTRFPEGVSVLICSVLAAGAAWEGACHRGTERTVALSAAALLIAAAITRCPGLRPEPVAPRGSLPNVRG